jgi:hypothetical protein
MTRAFWERWVIPAMLAGCALVLYLFTLSDVHTFDALSYIRDVDGRTGFFFHPHHLLYSPTGWLFWQSWRVFGYEGNSELALKVLNAITGAACGFALYRVIYGLTQQAVAACIAAGVFLFSYATWYFSAEVEVYVLALVWELLALAVMIELVTHPRPRTAPLLGIALGMAALYHQTNGLLVPVTILAVAIAPLGWQRKLLVLSVCGVLSALIVAAGYLGIGLGVNGYRSLDQLREWMFFFVETGWWGHAIRDRWTDLGSGLGNTISTVDALPYWVGIVVLTLLGVPAWRRWPRITVLALAWLVLYSAFFTWWEADNIEFWIASLLPLWLLLGLSIAGIGPRWLHRLAQSVGIAGIVLLAFHNFPIVERRGDATYDLQRQLSRGVMQGTTQNDLILAPGGVMELYLPYYENRPNVRTLNGVLFETNGDVAAALGRIATYVDQSLHAGLSVTIGRELIELPSDIFQRYDIPQEQLDGFWAPYRSAFQPLVIHDGTTYFWQIPSANTLAQGAGWRWSSFTWGWQAANITNVGFEDAWCFDPGSDPSLNGPLLKLDADSVQSMEVTLATRASGQTAQFFFGGEDGALSDAKSVQWEINGDGAPHTYSIPLGEVQGWNGTITRIRLDPIAVGDGTTQSRTCVQQLRFIP